MRTHAEAHNLCRQQKYEQAADVLLKNPSEDDMLYALDLGIAEHRAGDYQKSVQTLASNYPKMKRSAEAEISGDFYSSSLNTLGSIIDQLTNSDLVGTGTYRYAYGLQLRGQSAKYHLSTPEVARVAAFQLLNALKTDEENAGRIAMQHLSDMQPFLIEYNDDYPFIDQSFNELLMLTFFAATNDTAGNATVAYNRAIAEVNRATNSFTNDNSLEKAFRTFDKPAAILNQLYSRNLRRDLLSFAQKRKGTYSLTKSEVISTRLVSKSAYNELQKYIIRNCITPLKNGLRHHAKTLEERKRIITEQSNYSGSDRQGTLTLIVEEGNAPKLVNTSTQISFALLEPYQEPDQSLEISLIKNGHELSSSKLINAMDPDLLVQLDYQRYLGMLCKRLVNHIRSEEMKLCSKMVSYYSEIASIKQQMAQPQATDHLKRNLKNRLNYIVRGEKSRRARARQVALQRIKRLRYDHRVWYSQPNKLYMSTLPNIPVGKALIRIKRNGKIIKEQPVDIKSGSITLEVIGAL